jgi:hypothetical protein
MRGLDVMPARPPLQDLSAPPSYQPLSDDRIDLLACMIEERTVFGSWMIDQTRTPNIQPRDLFRALRVAGPDLLAMMVREDIRGIWLPMHQAVGVYEGYPVFESPPALISGDDLRRVIIRQPAARAFNTASEYWRKMSLLPIYMQ